MKILKTYFILGITSLLFACKSNSKLTGIYTNQFGDKVVVKKNETYLLKESLDNKERVTKGIWKTWSKDGIEKIQFMNIPSYEIDNNHTVSLEPTPDSHSNIKIYYADTDSIVTIPFAYGFFKSDTVQLLGHHQSYLQNISFSERLDSVDLSMWKYKNIIIKIPDTLNHNYLIRIYPTETISNFDRIFNIINNEFRPLDSNNTDKKLRFKKHGA